MKGSCCLFHLLDTCEGVHLKSYQLACSLGFAFSGLGPGPASVICWPCAVIWPCAIICCPCAPYNHIVSLSSRRLPKGAGGGAGGAGGPADMWLSYLRSMSLCWINGKPENSIHCHSWQRMGISLSSLVCDPIHTSQNKNEPLRQIWWSEWCPRRKDYSAIPGGWTKWQWPQHTSFCFPEAWICHPRKVRS